MGNQHKTIFLSGVDSLDLWNKEVYLHCICTLWFYRNKLGYTRVGDMYHLLFGVMSGLKF